MKKVFLLIISILPAFANEIVWNTVEFPPSLVTKGIFKDKGYSDKARILVSQNLSNYTHKLEYVNSARAIENLRTKDNVCFSGLNKNAKREEFVYFSEPFMKSLPNEIVIKKENLSLFKPYINNEGLIDFEKLIKDENYTFAYTFGRSYSNYIDTIIDKNRENKHIFYRPASDLTKGFLDMLRNNRVKYIIDYPIMVSFNSNNEFLTFPVLNSSDTFDVYIGCSKTKTGKSIISNIDKIIKENKSTFQSFYANYLDEDTKKRFLKDVQK